jgi:alpha-1,3-rhamnosyltransferase
MKVRATDASEERPLVSAIVPAYNHEKYVGATIDSLVAQTWPDLEVIVVNDGSPDATLEVIQSRRAICERRFVRYEVLDQSNAGVAAALNRGIEAARGEYVYLLSSDDISEPDAIATFVPILMNEPDVAVASGDCDFIDATGQKTSRGQHTSFMSFCASLRSDVIGDDFGSYASLLAGNYILPGLMMRRRAVLEVGGYDPRFAMEDYDLWLKLAKGHRFRFVDRVLCHYRWHGENTISKERERISYDELNLLTREAEYCISNGLGGLWSARTSDILAGLRARWQADIGVRDATVAELQGKVARCGAEIETTHALLESVASERDAALRQLEMVRSSLLWRVLKPARMIRNGLKRFRVKLLS